MRDDPHQLVLGVDDRDREKVVTGKLLGDDFLVVGHADGDHILLHDVREFRAGFARIKSRSEINPCSRRPSSMINT